MPDTVRAPPDQAINIPDAKALTIDFSEPCQRCQVECDYCRGWRELFYPEGGDSSLGSTKVA